LITICTIYDIFENQGGYLILVQSTGIGKTFNPILKSYKDIGGGGGGVGRSG
jgi:hypothetical protein